MDEIDCLDFAWAPATGLAEWFAAAGIDDRAPRPAGAAGGPCGSGVIAREQE